MSDNGRASNQRTPTPTQLPLSPHREDGSTSTLLLAALREMSEQRKALQAEHALAAAERKSERRWRMIFQALFFGAPLVFGLLYFLFFLSTTGFRWGPLTNVIGVIRIEGEIGSNKPASAENVIQALENAFSNPQVKAVVLAIDSPGGSPVEAERIYKSIQTLRRKHEKPVYSVIGNIGASAAYLIALHTDKIVAGQYSLIGSIGAIMAPWQLDRAIARLDVSQKVYASGKLKAFLNPFTPVTPEVDAKAKALVQQLGSAFVGELRRARGGRLKEGVDFGSGEVWSGLEAKAIGLVDSIGTLEEFVANGWDLKTYDFGPEAPAMGLLSRALSSGARAAIEAFVVQAQAPAIR